jgi:hypothetical protein
VVVLLRIGVLVFIGIDGSCRNSPFGYTKKWIYNTQYNYYWDHYHYYWDHYWDHYHYYWNHYWNHYWDHCHYYWNHCYYNSSSDYYASSAM